MKNLYLLFSHTACSLDERVDYPLALFNPLPGSHLPLNSAEGGNSTKLPLIGVLRTPIDPAASRVDRYLQTIELCEEVEWDPRDGLALVGGQLNADIKELNQRCARVHPNNVIVRGGRLMWVARSIGDVPKNMIPHTLTVVKPRADARPTPAPLKQSVEDTSEERLLALVLAALALQGNRLGGVNKSEIVQQAKEDARATLLQFELAEHPDMQPALPKPKKPRVVVVYSEPGLGMTQLASSLDIPALCFGGPAGMHLGMPTAQSHHCPYKDGAPQDPRRYQDILKHEARLGTTAVSIFHSCGNWDSADVQDVVNAALLNGLSVVVFLWGQPAVPGLQGHVDLTIVLPVKGDARAHILSVLKGE